MIVLGNDININQLEQEIYEYGCEIARELMSQVLKGLDDHLAKERNREIYRDKGGRKTSIKTLMGEVEYKRRVYEQKNDAGIKEYVYLLDEALEFQKVGMFSGNLAQLVIEAASNVSFRKAAKAIRSTTGQTISHGGVWHIVQAVGEKLGAEEKEQVKALTHECSQGKREQEILFEEADGVYLSIQGKDRKKAKRQELKVAISYEGWKAASSNRFETVNKLVCAGFEPADEFRKIKEGMLGLEYNLDEIKVRILNGDGAAWIKNHSTGEDVHYQLDPFHKNRAIVRYVQDKEARSTMLTFSKENKYEEILMYLSALEKDADDEKTKKKLNTLYHYLSENLIGLKPYLERGLDLPIPKEDLVYRTMGTMEHNICDTIGQRMKHRKGSWSIKGGSHMAKILACKASHRLEDALRRFTSGHVPQRLAEVVQGTLSSSKSPKTTGSGYDYPTKGAWPFEKASKTNGRSAVQQYLSLRSL